MLPLYASIIYVYIIVLHKHVDNWVHLKKQ